LKTSIPAAIKNAAAEVVAKHKDKNDDAKRAVVEKIMLPIAWDVGQVKKLHDNLAKTTGKDLDTALDDAAQRRMYYDLLAPMNLYNPGEIDDFKNYKIEKITFEDYKLDEIKGFLEKRLAAAVAESYDTSVHFGKYWQDGVKDASVKPEAMKDGSLKRDSIEKRHKIGFILFALSQVSVPTLENEADKKLDKKLVNKGLERAQVISGLYEFADASIKYVRTKRILEERLIAAILIDRQGITVKVKDNFVRTNGFIDEYKDEVDRLVKLAEQLDTETKRLKDLENKNKDLDKIYIQRVAQYSKALDELLESRKITAKFAEDLRKLQKQLHEAHVELADAADENYRLYLKIYELEIGDPKTGKKGGKKQP
jgi:hypothetical protein